MHHWSVRPIALQHELPTWRLRSCQASADGCGMGRVSVGASPRHPAGRLRATLGRSLLMRRCHRLAVNRLHARQMGQHASGCRWVRRTGHFVATRALFLSIDSSAGQECVDRIRLHRVRAWSHAHSVVASSAAIAPPAHAQRLRTRYAAQALTDAVNKRGDHAVVVLAARVRDPGTAWCKGAIYITCSCRQRRCVHCCALDQRRHIRVPRAGRVKV